MFGGSARPVKGELALVTFGTYNSSGRVARTRRLCSCAMSIVRHVSPSPSVHTHSLIPGLPPPSTIIPLVSTRSCGRTLHCPPLPSCAPSMITGAVQLSPSSEERALQ